MKKTFTDEQIVGILRGFEVSGLTIKEYCRQKDVSEQTFYKWRKRFGSLQNPHNHHDQSKHLFETSSQTDAGNSQARRLRAMAES